MGAVNALPLLLLARRCMATLRLCGGLWDGGAWATLTDVSRGVGVDAVGVDAVDASIPLLRLRGDVGSHGRMPVELHDAQARWHPRSAVGRLLLRDSHLGPCELHHLLDMLVWMAGIDR